MTTIILTFSILLQFIAASMALRLIPLTGKRMTWGLIAAALIFMVPRRIIPLVSLLSGNTTFQPDLSYEIIGLVISILMVVGISKIAPMFTARKQAEEKLEKAKQEWETIFQAIGHAAIILTPDHSIIAANRSVLNATGMTGKELLGKKCYEVFHPETLSPPKDCPMEKLFISGHMESNDMEINILGGIFHVNCTPVHDEKGKLQKVIHIATDITEHKRAEAKLKEAYDIISRSPVVAFLWKNAESWPVEFVTDNVETLFGYKAEELTSGEVSFSGTIHPDDLERVAKEIADYSKDERSHTFDHKPYRIVTKDGITKWVNDSTFIRRNEKGKITHYQGILFDITERRQSEAALRESEKRYRTLVETSQDLIYTTDKRGFLTYVNLSLEKILGYKTDELKGKSFAQISVPEYINTARDIFKRAMKGENIPVYEADLLQKDGTRIAVEFNTTTLSDSEGKPMGRYGIGRDITERRKMETALRQSEERFRRAVENIPDVIVIYDADLRIQFINAATRRITGHPASDFLGKREDEIWPPEVYQVYLPILQEALNTGKICSLETALLLPDTGMHNLSITCVPLNDEKGKTIEVLGITHDSTDRKREEEERKKLEAQLNQAQKMEAIGTLAGGIAHDFNNLLMSMQGNTSMMMDDLDPSHPHNEYLKGIQGQIKSAANLTKQLLGFAREGLYDVKPTDINEIVEKTAFMFGRTKKEIRIHRRYGEDLWPVETDANQMEQVLMNLFVNAGQAMPAGGDLFLKTRNVVLDEDYIKPYMTVPGRYVKISVTDTGVGMDEKTKQRIFEPFFTTKERGKGTGLGLSMVYGIIKAHKGFINVYSEPGHGTTFNIYLPASGKGVSPEISISSDIIRGTGTVLLVDDEATVLKVSQRMLERLGYNVIAEQSGKAAIDFYGEKKEEIDLVLLDMIMPEISGEEVFQHLREMNPGVKVILLSGYSLEGQAQKIIEQGCNGFLQKPVTLSELSQKISEVLNMKNEG